MKEITRNDNRNNYKQFYNIYPNINEVSSHSMRPSNKRKYDKLNNDLLYLDDEYGRLYSKEFIELSTPYGLSSDMPYYPPKLNLEIIDYLRVPFRKIPIYKPNSLAEVKQAQIELSNNDKIYKYLFRGQTSTYFLKREKENNELLYGEESVKEPSFHPSHLRNNYSEIFLQSMWINQATIILNDISVDLRDIYQEDYVAKYIEYRRSRVFYNFALGLAQHYGLPSVGLDLTDNIGVALWFATNKMNIAKSGKTTFNKITEFEDSTIYLFRCPEISVFEYKKIKPPNFPIGRPDKQAAWFGHVGWGFAKNQLASYLMCGFRINEEISDSLKPGIETSLFPQEKDDEILKYFLKVKAMDKYEKKSKEILKRIYYT